MESEPDSRGQLLVRLFPQESAGRYELQSNFFKGVYILGLRVWGIIWGMIIRVLKGNTGNLDYGLYEF